MAEYIKREEFYEQMNATGAEFSLCDALEMIEKFPAANVAPIEALEYLRDELYEQDLITMEGLRKLNTLIGKYTTVHDGGADHV